MEFRGTAGFGSNLRQTAEPHGPAGSNKHTMVLLQCGEIRVELQCLSEFKITAHEEAMLSWPTDGHGIWAVEVQVYGPAPSAALVPAERK